MKLKNMRKKYKYIIADGISPDNSIYNYQLLPVSVVSKIAPGSDVLWSDAIRVDATNIDSGKDDYDLYSSKEYKIRDLNPKIFVRKNFKWAEDKALTEKWLKNELPNDSRRGYLRSARNYEWTFRGFFTQAGYKDYKKYENDLLEECQSFVKEWARVNYINPKDFEVFKNWAVYIDVAIEMFMFRKADWKWQIESIIERKMEHYRITDEIFKNLDNEKTKDMIIKKELQEKINRDIQRKYAGKQYSSL